MGFTVYKTDRLNNTNQVAGNVAGVSLESGGQYEKGTVVYLFVWAEPETTTTTTTTPPTDSDNGNFWDNWFDNNSGNSDTGSDTESGDPQLYENN